MIDPEIEAAVAAAKTAHPGIFAKATRVFGSEEAASRFLIDPSMALDRKRPLDLLAIPGGAALVSQHLERLDFGVYT